MTKAEREAFEFLPDDERQCDFCKTTCFLSAVTCECSSTLVCLRHYECLCKCPPERHTLRYRYTLDELPTMLTKVGEKAKVYETWVKTVTTALDQTDQTNKKQYMDLKLLLDEAKQKKFPINVYYENLRMVLAAADACLSVIEHLELNKMRTRTRTNVKYKLSLQELTLFCDEINSLPCTLKETSMLKELESQALIFVKQAKSLLGLKLKDVNIEELEACIEAGNMLTIELTDLRPLRARRDQIKWLNKLHDFGKGTMDLDTLKSMLAEGIALVPDSVVEKELALLQETLNSVSF